MDEPAIERARQRLAEATSQRDRIRADAERKGTVDYGRLDEQAAAGAWLEVLAAERELASATGEEYAVELEVDAWDIGAPTPFLVSDGYQAAVVFQLPIQDPSSDGTYVTVVDPSSEAVQSMGVIEFDGMYDVKFGGLNDEAIEGHPLWGRGLRPYCVHQVVNSSWIAESERRNSVHPHHLGGWHQRFEHYVLCFQDVILECIATGMRARRVTGSFGEVMRSVSTELLG